VAKTNKKKVPTLKNALINGSPFFTHISKTMGKRKYRAGIYINYEVTIMYLEISYYIYNETTYISILAKESQQCQ